jgi:outer membrane lipoprotein-sorting protein
MKARGRLASVGALLVPILLTGCSLFPTTRRLPVPKAPHIEQTITPEELVARLNQRWEAIKTLTATVEMQASVSKSKEGVAKDYPSAHGQILLRKPSDLRVLGRYFGVSVFDMASDGKCFTLFYPHDNKVIKGCGPSKTKSANTYENLRPGFFFDAMFVRGLDPDDHYSRTSETFMVEDAARKHLFSVPLYILHITRYREGVQEETTARDIYFHRDDLLPYQQDVYDKEGNLETQVFYQGYQDFEGGQYPSSITIKRPIEEIQIVLTVDTVHENTPLPNDQFVVQIPEGAKIQNIE